MPKVQLIHPMVLIAFALSPVRAPVHGLRPTASPPSLQSPPMKIINSIMVVVGWIVVVCALLAAFGLGTVHLHFGPFDFRLPASFR